MKKEEIKELGIKIGASRAEIKGNNVVFIFNVATDVNTQEQDCISSVYGQSNEVLKNAGFTINSVKVNKFNAEDTTNEVKLVCKANEDINKEYDNMEKKVMNDSVNDIRHQLNNPWLSQKTKEELYEKLYNLQQEGKLKKVKDSVAPESDKLSIHEKAALTFYLRYDMGFSFDDLMDAYPDAVDRDAAFYDDIKYHEKNNDTEFFDDTVNWAYPTKEDYADILAEAVKDYDEYGSKTQVQDTSKEDMLKPHEKLLKAFTPHEKAALLFYARNFDNPDPVSLGYSDKDELEDVIYSWAKSYEKDSDDFDMNWTLVNVYRDKNAREILSEAVADYENYQPHNNQQTQVQDDGMYQQTNTGKPRWYVNAREEREALAGAHRYHTPYPYSGTKEDDPQKSKEYDEKYFSIDNFGKLLLDYFGSVEKNMPHNKNIPAPSYEAVIGATLGEDRLKQLLNNVLENTKYMERRFFNRHPELRESFYDPKLVRDYLTREDLVKMLRPEEKAKVIQFLRFPPYTMSKEQQKAYEMMHPKDPAEQLNQDLERAKSQSRAIKENNNSEFSQLIRAYVKTGKGDYQDEIRNILGGQRYADVLKLDAMFIPQVHFQMLTKEEQNKLLDFFKKETQINDSAKIKDNISDPEDVEYEYNFEDEALKSYIVSLTPIGGGPEKEFLVFATTADDALVYCVSYAVKKNLTYLYETQDEVEAKAKAQNKDVDLWLLTSGYEYIYTVDAPEDVYISQKNRTEQTDYLDRLLKEEEFSTGHYAPAIYEGYVTEE